jgi:hypothetical protein
MRGPIYTFQVTDGQTTETVLHRSHLDAVKRFKNGEHASHDLFLQQKKWRAQERVYRCFCGATLQTKKLGRAR